MTEAYHAEKTEIPSQYSTKKAPLQRWTPHVLLLLMTIGFASCVAFAVHNDLSRSPLPGSDSREYDSYAWNLAQGRGFRGISPDVRGLDGQLLDHPTAYRAPGTSVLWASLYWSVGHRYSAVRIAQCLMHMMTIPLIYAIGQRCFDNSAALL